MRPIETADWYSFEANRCESGSFCDMNWPRFCTTLASFLYHGICFPDVRRDAGFSDIKFAFAIIDGKKSKRVKRAFVAAALPGDDDESTTKQFIDRPIESCFRPPPLTLHEGPGGLEIAVIHSIELVSQVYEQLHRRCTQCGVLAASGD